MESIKRLKPENNELQMKVKSLEDNQRKKYIIIFDMKEDWSENKVGPYNTVRHLCNMSFRLVMNEDHIEEAIRLGRGKN